MVADERPRWQRVYAIAVCAAIGGALTYALCDWAQATRLLFHPYDGTWSWRDGPTASIPINYYGTILWGLGGAAVGALIAAAATAWWRRPIPRAVQRLGAAWALTAVILSGAYFHWNLWPF
jgi:hypothetical protein